MTPMALRRIALFASSCAFVLACSSASVDDGAEGQANDVTSVPETDVKDQSIGNCWIYATLGWVESLHLSHSGETLNLSESYLTYLAAFTRITSDEFVFDVRGDWNTGDFFGEGGELITRYGVMDEAAFIASEATASRSARQEQANTAIAAALKTGGALATKEARRDPAKVRAVLDAAYALPPSIVTMMTAAFGPDLSKTRGRGATLPGSDKGFHDPATMIVAKTNDGHDVTLDEAFGTLDPARQLVSGVRDRKERIGPHAWQRVEIIHGDDAANATAVLRMKKALNAGFPVPIDWYPAWDSMQRDDGSFHAPVRGEGGWHASLAHDYEIEVGPPAARRVLAAGTPVTDPALLAATLEPTATMKFLRLKNSWGREIGPLSARGYTDTMWDYLMFDFERPRIDYDEKKEAGYAVTAFVVPPPSWDGAAH